MRIEYLLFNLFVIAGPFALSFEPKIRFAAQYRRIAASILPPAALFIIWDACVAGRHWFFNPAYTLPQRVLDLPIEEWLFFFTVPYASLFVWENIRLYLRQRIRPALGWLRAALALALPVGVVLYGAGWEYTSLALVAIGLGALLDRALRTDVLLDLRMYVFFAVATLLILVCNGYLTARPVVTYATRYQLDLRIFTIPVEDVVYGYALLLMVVVLYEALRGEHDG